MFDPSTDRALRVVQERLAAGVRVYSQRSLTATLEHRPTDAALYGEIAESLTQMHASVTEALTPAAAAAA